MLKEKSSKIQIFASYVGRLTVVVPPSTCILRENIRADHPISIELKGIFNLMIECRGAFSVPSVD